MTAWFEQFGDHFKYGSDEEVSKLVLNYKTGTTPGEETTAGQGNDSRSYTEVIKDTGRLKNLLKNNFKMSEYQLKSALIRFKNELKMDDSFFAANSNN